MGGHVAEKLIIGSENISSGCSSDLLNATELASSAVRYYGMFGDEVSYISKNKTDTSDEHNYEVDKAVQKILDESFERVKILLTEKDKELRELSK
jgi:ATP-dependent metalloprotease